MPITALPKHLQEDPLPEGDGTDHDNKAQKFWSRAWTAWGPNADDSWDWITICGIPFTKHRLCLPIKLPAKWRRFPILVLGFNVTRWMPKGDEGGEKRVWALENRWTFWESEVYWVDPDTGAQTRIGPSPIQKGARFSFMIVWPLGVMFTVRWKSGKKIKTIFARGFGRWDSLDDYHVCPAWFAGGNYN